MKAAETAIGKPLFKASDGRLHQEKGRITVESEKRTFRGSVFPERQEIGYLLVLLALCALLFFFPIGNRPIWDGDEGMHATTSKEMVRSGDWITPTFNRENFYDKPVLYNWLVSLSFLAFGFTESAARLPSALLGTGCVIVVYLFGRALFHPLAGFLGGVILATSVEMIILSQVVVHDIALAFWITLSLYFFYRGFQEERLQRRCFLLFYASSGLAVLAKGPIGALLPGLLILLFLSFQKRLSLLRTLISGWGILIFLAIASPWYLLISLKNRGYGEYFFLHQNLMNFLSAEARHSNPFYFYLPVLFGGFLPWSFILPCGLVHAFQEGFLKKNREILFLLLWFLTIFLFFTAASSKLPTYILPLFPAISLLAGVLWSDLWTAPKPRLQKVLFYSLLPFGVALPGALVLLLWMPPKDMGAEYGLSLSLVAPVLVLPILSIWLSLFLIRARRWKASFWSIAAMVVAVFFILNLQIVPAVNPYRSTQRLARELDRRLMPGEDLVFFRVMRSSALFYTDRKGTVLMTYPQVAAFLDSPKRVFGLMRKGLLEEQPRLKDQVHILDQEGNRVIVSNKK